MTEWKPRRSPRYVRKDGPQNRSPAVMAQRFEALDSLDDFPTPRWATRALTEHVLEPDLFRGRSCWEPTCGRGFMAKTLAEYFGHVRSSDIHPYGFGEILDFVNDDEAKSRTCDWIVTNPPFRLAEEFARRAIRQSKIGSAMLVRTNFIEGVGRFNRLFRDMPPAIVAQFVERVPILRGRVDAAASTATGYCWLVWLHEFAEPTRLVWIPPCRRILERDGDYDLPDASTEVS